MQKKKSPLQDILMKVENHDLEVARNEMEPVKEVDVVAGVKSASKKKSKKTVLETITNEGSDLKNEQQEDQNAGSGKTPTEEKAPSIEVTTELPDSSRKHRFQLFGIILASLAVGFLICYFFLLIPLQNQVTEFTTAFTDGSTSSNQMKSDLSTTKLKQQEMETRYQAVSNQLESANQYIFLLRMKEQIAVAQMLVEQKEGLKARQSLSEIQNRFDHLKPFVVKKDIAAAEKLDGLIKSSIQHLASDPEVIKTDLADISDHLNSIETTLFQPK
jgi:hypothetical protein